MHTSGGRETASVNQGVCHGAAVVGACQFQGGERRYDVGFHPNGLSLRFIIVISVKTRGSTDCTTMHSVNGKLQATATDMENYHECFSLKTAMALRKS